MEKLGNSTASFEDIKPLSQDEQPDDPYILVRRLQEEVDSLREEVVQLQTTVASQDKRIAKNNEYSEELDKILNDFAYEVNEQFKRINKTQSTGAGKTTAKRCDEVIRLLREHNGQMSFKGLRFRMGLKPNQFSRVISALDKRRFEIINVRGKEKILRFKARLI